jgi:hypothetical protein
MNRGARLVVGGTLVAVVLVVIILFTTVIHPQAPKVVATPTAKPQITINCSIGSEKADLMHDSDVQRILSQKYGITVNFKVQGSLDQATLTTDQIKQQGLDCLWPSSMAAQNVFQALHSNAFPAYRAETVLNSPEVIYAGPEGTNALQKKGIVQQRSGRYYIVNMKALLLNYVLKGMTWESLGTADIRGPIAIGSTDPAQSNSGFTLSMLELVIVSTNNPYQVPDAQQAKAALRTIRALYDAQGLQATSSAFGFDQWLLQGGEFRYPLYAGYESQILEEALKNKDVLKDVRVLYPEPTVYNDHPILALDTKAAHLIDAMKDSDIQKIAWTRYGFRSVQLGVTNVNNFPNVPIAEHIQATNVPDAEVIQMLQNCLRNNVCQ